MAPTTTVGILKALLTLDTSGFAAAMADAGSDTTKLAKKLQDELEPRQRAINQLTKDFLGGSEIRRAQEYAAAISAIGGASKLTADDQAKANRAVTDALDHYRALGQEAPAHLLALQNATKQTGSVTSSLFGDLAGGLTAGVIAGGITAVTSGIVALGKGAIDAASHIVDLSEKTGLSTDAVQRYGFVAEQTGSSVENMADATFKLGVNIEQGGQKTRSALQSLGISYLDIKNLQPEEQFDLIARKLSAVTDTSERNALGVDLMGKSYGAIAGSITEYNDLVDKAHVATKENVQALDAAGDAWHDFWSGVETGAIDAAGQVVLAFKNMNAEIGAAHSLSGIRAANSLNDATNADALTMGRGVGAVRASQADEESFAATLKAAQLEVQGLTQAQRDELAAAQTLGRNLDELQAKYDLSNDAMKVLSGSLKENTKDLAKTETAAKATADSLAQLHADADRAEILSTERTFEQKRALLDLEERTALASARRKYTNEADFDKAATDLHRKASAERRQIDQEEADANLEAHSWLLDQIQKTNQQLGGDKLGGVFDLSASDARLRSFTTGKDLMQAFSLPVAKIDDKPGQKLDELAVSLGVVSHLIDDIGEQTTGAMRTVTSAVTGGIQIWQKYRAAAGAAGAGASAAAAGATLGISLGIQALASWISKGRQQVAEIEGLKKQIEGLGASAVTPVDSLGHLLNNGQYIDVLTHQLDLMKRNADAAQHLADLEQKANLAWSDQSGAAGAQALGDHIRDLEMDLTHLIVSGFSAAQAVKGLQPDIEAVIAASLSMHEALPASLEPFIAQLLKSGGISDDLKRKLLGIPEAIKVPWQDMQKDAEKWGIDLASLGGQFNEAKFASDTADLAADWHLLADNGADVAAVNEKMKDKANEFLHTALTFGTLIPASMKPMLESMEKQGLLTDANGRKLENLDGVNFAPDIEADFQTLIDKLTGPDGVVDALNRMIGALGELGKTNVDIGIGYHLNGSIPGPAPSHTDSHGNAIPDPPSDGAPGGATPDAPGYFDENGVYHVWELPQHALGGIATKATAGIFGEKGPEALVPLNQADKFGFGSKPIYLTVISKIDGREVARANRRYGPSDLVNAGL